MNQEQNNLNKNNTNNQVVQNSNIIGYDTQTGKPIYGNQNNNNNKNNNKLVIAIIVIIVLILIILLLVKDIMWNNYVEEKYQEAEDKIMDDINNIGDIDDIKSDDNEEETIDISNYDDMIEYDASACGIGASKKFILKDGNLIFVNLDTNEVYKMKSITNAKSILRYNDSFSCDLDQYIILTNDGKVYYSSNTVSYIEDMQEFENEFKQVNSSYSFESIEVSNNFGPSLLGKTKTGETIALNYLLK